MFLETHAVLLPSLANCYSPSCTPAGSSHLGCSTDALTVSHPHPCALLRIVLFHVAAENKENTHSHPSPKGSTQSQSVSLTLWAPYLEHSVQFMNQHMPPAVSTTLVQCEGWIASYFFFSPQCALSSFPRLWYCSGSWVCHDLQAVTRKLSVSLVPVSPCVSGLCWQHWYLLLRGIIHAHWNPTVRRRYSARHL